MFKHLNIFNQGILRSSEDLNKLAKDVFEKEEYKKEWDKIYENKDNRDNTYTSFQLFQQIYQKHFPYRLGIVDGAHCMSVLFYILHELQLEEEQLTKFP